MAGSSGSADNPIGSFLRARREQVRPEDVGLPDYGRRRVPGLRREELAMLAGVSADYYVRLEQGRDQHPSEQVVDALARALQLDDDAAAHLHELTRPAPRSRRRRPARVERVRPGLIALMAQFTNNPAFVLGRRMDVLAANELSLALNPRCAPPTNLVRSLFLEETYARELYPEYEDVAVETVATLRASVGADLDDPALTDLVGELSLKSERFRKLWARHDVKDKADGIKSYMHPLVGPLELRYETFSINGADGQMLAVYHAEPGSPSAQALALLSSMAASPPSDPRPRPSDRASAPARPDR
jgi:transcriptional regulator with XRE-family HTH domain